MLFPMHGPKRRKDSEKTGEIIKEACLSVNQLIQLFFIIYEKGKEVANQWPPCSGLSVDQLVSQVNVTDVRLFGQMELSSMPSSQMDPLMWEKPWEAQLHLEKGLVSPWFWM